MLMSEIGPSVCEGICSKCRIRDDNSTIGDGDGDNTGGVDLIEEASYSRSRRG
jgi:hypothetical protein